ncbi:polysaccharide lyase [Metapseudomonas otitidis]|uniref:polysaccharide lyase n=1 Tax=Metapseudomonas otitidis TaxID=319939 RepID=UPI00262C858A|nr:polysaccharide lyase [Pseudomonas otitidis]
MSMSRHMLCALALLLVLPMSPAQAVNSLWANQATPQAAMVGDYRSLGCPYPAPEPYTGALQFESKYDQSDVTKSRLSATPDVQAKKVQAQVKGYIGGLIRASKEFQRAKRPERANQALACLDTWLGRWAHARALENPDASKTGIAARKWALAAIGSTLLKVRALSDGRYELDSEQRAWLERLAERVIAEYQPRHVPDFPYFNNHDYWAGWAVASVGMLVEREDFIAWADYSLRRGLAQAQRSTSGDYAYLPLEVARGKLASTYTQYALVPLVLLVESAEANGRPLSGDERQTLWLLASFAARSQLEPEKLPELQAHDQDEVAPYKLAWLIPYLHRYPGHPWARRLYDEMGGDVDNYSQIGGPIKPMYPTQD